MPYRSYMFRYNVILWIEAQVAYVTQKGNKEVPAVNIWKCNHLNLGYGYRPPCIIIFPSVFDHVAQKAKSEVPAVNVGTVAPKPALNPLPT